MVYLLSKRNVEDIYLFEDILTAKLFELDGKRFAIEMGEGGYGDDSDYFFVDEFLYSRCVVVANGQKYFLDVINNSKKFPKDMEFETLLSISQEAFERKTNTSWSYGGDISYETYSNEEGWQ